VADLSPAAQAVLDAYKKGGLDAALRAAAREIEPTMEERKTDPNRRGPGFFNGVSCGCAQLLSLATELEADRG
jgi:hypothetical protein